MSTVKWFSGGNERGDQAVNIINVLLDYKDLSQNDQLRKTLLEYKVELQKQGSSVPFILSRMNLDISKSLRNDGVYLNEEQKKYLKQLTSLSNIRYGNQINYLYHFIFDNEKVIFLFGIIGVVLSKNCDFK